MLRLKLREGASAMSTIKSWGIVENRRRSELTAAQTPSTPAPASFAGVRSTGFFQTPPDEGIPTNLSIFLSSFDTETRRVVVRVNRLIGDTVEPIFSRSLDVPSGEGRRLDVDDVAGQTLEIRIEAEDEIIPSAVVANYFIADGGIIVQVYRSPSDFVRI